MPTTTSALTSLLPLAGAAALTFQGVRRMIARRGAEPRPAAPPPQPIEIPSPTPRRPAARTAVPDAACTDCGTSIPGRQTRCTACERRIAGAANSGAKTSLHWLVFIVVMTAIIGGGALLAP